MKIAIDCGHNCYPDTGCDGIVFEDKLTLEVGTLVKKKLQTLGHIVVDCNPKQANSVVDSLEQRVTIANQAKVNIYVSIHFNCYNGEAYGTEIYAVSTNGKKYAQSVVDEIAKLGFFNRGVKNGEEYYVIRNTSMPAILIECCFCDSKRDMGIFNAEKMATAIVNGLIK